MEKNETNVKGHWRTKRFIIRLLLLKPTGLEDRYIGDCVKEKFNKTRNNAYGHLNTFEDWKLIERFSRHRKRCSRIPKKYFKTKKGQLEFMSISCDKLKIEESGHLRNITLLLTGRDNFDDCKAGLLLIKYGKEKRKERLKAAGIDPNYKSVPYLISRDCLHYFDYILTNLCLPRHTYWGGLGFIVEFLLAKNMDKKVSDIYPKALEVWEESIKAEKEDFESLKENISRLETTASSKKLCERKILQEIVKKLNEKIDRMDRTINPKSFDQIYKEGWKGFY